MKTIAFVTRMTPEKGKEIKGVTCRKSEIYNINTAKVRSLREVSASKALKTYIIYDEKGRRFYVIVINVPTIMTQEKPKPDLRCRGIGLIPKNKKIVESVSCDVRRKDLIITDMESALVYQVETVKGKNILVVTFV